MTSNVRSDKSKISIMNENQQNSSSSFQIRISPDESTTFSQTFKSEEIRFFDLKLNTSLDKKDTISLKKKFWIWNVFVFIQQIKDIITYKKNKIVCANLLTCLRNAAQWWYSNEFSEWNKIMLRVDINQWYTALIKCFHENFMIAIRKLNEIQYNWQNVHNSVSLSSYIAQVLQLAEISYTDTQQVLLVVYKNLKVKMPHDIKMLTFQTTKKEFIQQMKNQHHNWEDIFN